MKKIFSGFVKGFLLSIVGIIAFMWIFSVLFPRAYYVIEGKVLGIKEDSIPTVVKPPIIPKVDSTKVVEPTTKDFKLAVKLEHRDNCYSIPIKVNGIPMKMLLDTGASNLTISIVEYEFLRKQGLLKDNTAEETHATIANGETVKCYSIKIDEVTIGGISVKDIECTVMEQQDAEPLLGMNVLRKLGNFSIDYQRNLLILK